METAHTNRTSHSAVVFLLLLSTAFIAFWTYREALGYYFTAPDSMTLIETSRVGSLGEIVNILSKPLMSGTGFDRMGSFYRPVATLSYSLDYALWGLNPLGYHLTDIGLHVSVTVLVFLLMLNLTHGERAMAWLAAILFATHPILVESVPAIPRRQDLIAGLFLVLSLLFFRKHLATTPLRRLACLTLSLLCCILAIGAKETGVVVAPLIFAHILLLVEEPTTTRREAVARAFKGSLPYFVATLLTLVWRTHVLQGLGGYPHESSLILAVREFSIIPNYLMDLFSPVGILGPIYAMSASSTHKVVSVAGFMVVLALIVTSRRVLRRLVADDASRRVRVAKLVLSVVALVSLVSLSAYPFLSSLADKVLQAGYQGHGPHLFVRFLKGWRRIADGSGFPVSADLYFVRKVIDLTFGFLFVFCTLFLVGLHRRRKIRDYLSASPWGKLVSFFLVWALLPLTLYLVTLTFEHRLMYIPVIPFACVLSVLLVRSFRALSSMTILQREGVPTTATSRQQFVSRVANFAATGFLAIWLVAFSPLVWPYREWEDVGRMTSMILSQLASVAPSYPGNAVIHIYNLPGSLLSYRFPSVKTSLCLSDYAVESWLRMKFPDKHLKVVVETWSNPSTCPAKLKVDTTIVQDRVVLATVRLDVR
jgi:hypothetical protein